MKNLAASLLCVLLGACAAPKFPLSPTHVSEPAVAPGAIPEPVQHSAALPPPRPALRQETYSVSVHRVPVQSVLFALARDAGLNVDVHPDVQGTVTLNALDQTLPQLLARIGKQVDMRYELQGKSLVVLPDQPYWNHYKIDYVNIARSTNSSVSIATQISTTGGSAASGASAGGATPSNPVPTTSAALGSGTNNSTTSVVNRSDNNFWYNLEKNVRDMLRPTTLNDPLADPLAQMREQASTMLQQLQTGGAGGPADAGYPGAQASAAQARAPVGGPAANTAFGAAASGQGRTSVSVISNPEGGLLSVRATGRQHEKVQEFLDIVLSAAKRQVLIEATIIEVKLSDQYQQGINWSRINGHGKLGQGQVGTLPLPSGVNPLSSPGFFIFDYSNPVTRFGNISATIQLLESFGKVKVLSSPKISVLNNQTALLKVVDNSIFFTLKVTPAVLTSNSTVVTPATYESKVETVPVGFVMSVTPQISADDEVTLNVRPTITRIVDYVSDPNPELQKLNVNSRVPVIQAREMESILKVQSGQVAVMGGLMQDSVDNKKDAIPLLGKVPVLGDMFSYRNETASKTELVIFLRPVVVKDASLAGDYRNYRYLMPSGSTEGL
jgi:general secretion pathway protein D